MQIDFIFATIYFPGENEPGQLEVEGAQRIEWPCLPRPTDHAYHNGQEYRVFKVGHPLSSPSSPPVVTVTRIVPYPPTNKDRKL